MTTLILTGAPSLTTDKVILAYRVDRGEKGGDDLTIVMNRADRTSYLPDKKQDAIAGCIIWDACTEYVGQELRAAFVGYRKDLSVWNARLKTLVERGTGGKAGDLVTHMRSKPVKPDVPSDVAARIAPFESFLTLMKAGWSGARRHTLSVFGTGKGKGSIIWTGTLSSLTRTRPNTGVIAKGRRII